MLSVQSSTVSLFASRYVGLAGTAYADSLSKLSSGIKLNGARDDAAGLSVSTRLSSQINGLGVGMRNANDAAGLLQTAEGALAEVTANIQRIRALALQAANDTYSNADRQSLQAEVIQLQREIDRIGETTRFGGLNVFSNTSQPAMDISERDIVRGLRDSWLYESEQLIAEQLGLEGKENTFAIDLEYVDGASGVQAFVEFASGVVAKEVRLVIDLDDFSGGITKENAESLTGTILHEMVHAVMAVNMNSSALPIWFNEGTAESMRGADARVLQEAAALGSGNVNTGLTAIRDELIANWEGSTSTPSSALEIAAVYSGGYIAMRYLQNEIGQSGIKNLMSELSNGSSFNAALSTASGGRYATENAFFSELNTGTNFVDFVNNTMNLYNDDLGAFGGSDASGGPVKRTSLNGLSGLGAGASKFLEFFVTGDNDRDNSDFSVSNVSRMLNGVASLTKLEVAELGIYENEIQGTGGRSIDFQVGAQDFQTISVTLGSVGVDVLGLGNIDIINLPQFAIYATDDALTAIDNQRALLGAATNRLTSTVNNLSNIQMNSANSRAQIRDTDFAQETARLVQKQTLLSASNSMLAQANTQVQAALALLV